MTIKRFGFSNFDDLNLPPGLESVTELLPGGFFLSPCGRGFTVMRVTDAKGNVGPVGQQGGWPRFKEGLAAIRAMQDVLVRQT